MPRDLSELMEQAVSSAPPEKYHAGEITRAAERAQRRRTTWVAASAAAAVVIVAGVTVGLTQHHPTKPEPAHRPYLYGRTVDLSAAVPASSLPGYRDVPFSIPSVQRLGKQTYPNPTYREVDASGHLIVTRFVDPTTSRSTLFDVTGRAVTPAAPSLPGKPAVPDPSTFSFYEGDRLLWPTKSGFYLTDLQGREPVYVNSRLRYKNLVFGGTPGSPAGDAQASSDSLWATFYDHADPKTGTIFHDLYRATFSGQVTEVAHDVAVFHVADGMAGWVTTNSQVVVGNAGGGSQRPVKVPLDRGCTVSPTAMLQTSHPFVVTSSVVAITERCGSGKKQVDQLLAFDLEGHRLVTLTGLQTYQIASAGRTLLVAGLTPGSLSTQLLRYDLTTGSLARLIAPTTKRLLQQQPQGAGGYLLWYDATAGHVAYLPG